MDWRKELDALIFETAAMAPAGHPAAAMPKPPPPVPPPAPIDLVVSILQEPSRLGPRPYNFGPPEQEFIKKRVDGFRAHQERVRREREDYCSKVMQRVREAISDRRMLDD